MLKEMPLTILSENDLKEVDCITISHTLPSLLNLLNTTKPNQANATNSQAELYNYFKTLMTGTIRQQENQQIRENTYSTLGANRHQITSIKNGLFFTENNHTTDINVHLALADYNLIQNPEAILTEAAQNYIFTMGISNLGKAPPKWLHRFYEFTQPGFKSTTMESFYLENRQAIVAAALVAKDTKSCQKIITHWMKQTNQTYTTFNNRYVDEFHPSTVENFVQNAIGTGFIRLNKHTENKLTI